MDQLNDKDLFLISLGIISILVSPLLYKPSTKKKQSYKYKLFSIISLHIGEPPRDKPTHHYFPFRIGSIPLALYVLGLILILVGIPQVNQFLDGFDKGSRAVIFIVGVIIVAIVFKLIQRITSKK